MSDMPWLTILLAVPALGALALVLMPRGFARSREFALGVSLVTLAIALFVGLEFIVGNGHVQLQETYSWIPQFGVSFALGVDGIALSMILLSVILVPICLIAAWDDVPSDGTRRQQGYVAWILLLEAMMIGVFAATDVFLFYVFFEAMLVPVYFLIGQYGGPERAAAATKFLLYSLLGGLIMLVAVIGLYVAGPGGSEGFLLENLTGLEIGGVTEKLLFLGFFIAFAIKAPMFPVHTWLPQAATEARPSTAVLLVGVLDKVGTFGMLRYCLQLFPEASKWATPLVLVLAVISIIYGALLAIGQKDMMRLIAFTSISHFGFIVLGIFAMTTISQTGSTLYMVNHGFTTAALFLIAGMLIARRGSRNIADYGGWQRVTPVIAGTLLVAGLSGLALPGLNAFVSEFMVIVGTFQRYPAAAVLGATGVILAALYILLWYQKIATGPKPENLSTTRDMTVREKFVVVPLIGALLVLGFYPKPVIDMLEPAVTITLQHVGVTDPAPATSADGSEG
ncbi:NADH-quinone oxidoreductase subunit M [Ornithinimicrobium faecis]|uniref:NADH-quinone oxidoreductase subunit M n=1 Tax=Ornithinimicrobium faecis TaxID=2934158 RepID=A0ABY4YVP9_9MICO|nr:MULTISPECIES: NADH-quinone oxidoreductase subunit M [unclassified Ornithinimicrobium]USQ80827.1 NADH-quinone oxidoreductase subunit M [Ornithinimicrobium sp. HY1793]